MMRDTLGRFVLGHGEEWTDEMKQSLLTNLDKSLEDLERLFPDKTRRDILNKIRYLGISYRMVKTIEIARKRLELSETDKAYIAGIVDGEGTIRISITDGLFDPRVSVANSMEELLHWVKNKIGYGFISRREYYCNDYATKPVLEAIRPYLILKRRHADLVLEFISLRLSRKRWCEAYTAREIEIVEEVKKLNVKPHLSQRIPTQKEVMEYMKINQLNISAPSGE